MLDEETRQLVDAPDSEEIALFQLLYLSGVLKKGRLSSDDACCKAPGLAHFLKGVGGQNPIWNIIEMSQFCLQRI